LIANEKKVTIHRAPSLFLQRLNWDVFCNINALHRDFPRHIRMSAESFRKLVEILRMDLEVDEEQASYRGGAILPEICVYICLRYLAGGSYSDIKFLTGISVSSFYRVLWKTIAAINKASHELLAITFPSSIEATGEAALGFQSISSQGCIWNCVAAIDGYHLQISTPSKKEAKNVTSFFSGHYQTHGVNIQAACDHNCRFVFIGVAGPGNMGDREAIQEVSIGKIN
jgi:DDE superfamily endonuclease